MRRSRQETQAATRRALLDAAAAVFAEAGFHAATIEAITERAGFTRGAFYANFADKSDLFLTVLEELTQHELADIDARLADAGDDELDTLAAVVDWFEQTSKPTALDLALAEFWPVASRSEPLRARLAANSTRLHRHAEALVASYCERAQVQLPIEPADMTAIVLALADGLDRLGRIHPDLDRSRLFRTGITSVWYGLETAREITPDQPRLR